MRAIESKDLARAAHRQHQGIHPSSARVFDA